MKDRRAIFEIHKFPTDGDSAFADKSVNCYQQPIRCDSETDSIVWMREDKYRTIWYCVM